MLNQQQQLHESAKRHIKWVPLYESTVNVECAILRTFPNDDVLLVTIESLDEIDRRRLLNALSRPNSHMMDLWEVLQSITLNNGVNGLQYFHQLAVMRTSQGVVMKPQIGRGSAAPVPKQNSVTQPTVDTRIKSGEVVASKTPVVETPVVETPVVETPVVETPVVETPVATTRRSSYKPKTQK